MKIVSVGGGPAGLYTGILMKRADPGAAVTVLERNRPDDTFGFGVVFSDATLENLAAADPESFELIRGAFAHWDDIDIHWRGQVLRSTGHGFCGMERRLLLKILQDRCRELGVELLFEHEVDEAGIEALVGSADVLLGADGVSSGVRQHFAADLQPDIDVRPNRFVWLGTQFPFQAFTFYFKENDHGLWRVHAYRYRDAGSTFIVECTAETFARAGLAEDDEDSTIAYLEETFGAELAGYSLTKNRSIWRSFPTVRNRRWHSGNAVLVGDAAHTAHFSIGSGTKLAMEDAIALSQALVQAGPGADAGAIEAALTEYEKARRPAVEGLQRAAQVSLEWFESTERYQDMAPVQLAFSLLTRSLRVTHGNLARRDPALVAQVDAWFAERAGVSVRPPALVPVELGGRRLENRVVAAAGAGARAVEGVTPGLVLPGEREGLHIVALAVGGEPEDVVADAREARTGGAHAVLVGTPGAGAGRLAHVSLADRVRHEAGVPVVVAGGIRTLDEVSTIVAAGRADLVVVDPPP